MSLIKTISLPSIGDGRGELVAIEGLKTIPFEIARVYYLMQLNEHARGFHAHKKLKQVVICLHGSCRFVLDDGVKREQIILDNPNTALFIENMTWREMYDFKNECVILVLADTYYDEADYIRDYDDFLRLSRQRIQELANEID